MATKKDEEREERRFENFYEQLWSYDTNRLKPGEDYVLDIQGRTRYCKKGRDKADEALFAELSSHVFKKPTFKAFQALLDNYESTTGVAEEITDQEERENWDFINLVFASKPMQYAYEFLKYKGKVSTDKDVFKKTFYDIWFGLYKRSKKSRELDSSGFEHVFVGETRGRKVIGFHNWIQFYLQEKAGNVDYKGFMASDGNPHLLTIQFSWKNGIKPKGSSLIGVSPEFEITLYTVCYFMGQSSYKITLGGEPVIVQCYATDGVLGTCYVRNS